MNAIESGATTVEAILSSDPDIFDIDVRDNGRGMSADALRDVADPGIERRGKHAARRMGLGLPFLYQTAAAAGGTVRLTSTPGVGTRIGFHVDRHHLDAPPMGDLPGTLLGALAFPGAHTLDITRRHNGETAWTVSRGELIAVLGDLDRAENLLAARRYLLSLESDLEEPLKP